MDTLLKIRPYERIGDEVRARLVREATDMSYAQSARVVTNGQVSRQSVRNCILRCHLPERKEVEEKRKAIFTNKARLAEDKNGRTNILIFGTSGYSMSENAWDGAMLTDSIMLVSIDQDKNNAYMISLPRDLYVKYKCPALGRTSGKLNEVFYCAYTKNKDEKAGAQALMGKVSEILGLNVHYYMHADWTALVQSVNAVGGVDVKIESTQ